MKESFYKFVLFIPVFFALALNLTGYFNPRSLNPGTVRGFIMIIFLFYFLLKYYPGTYTNRFILFFISYIGVLTLFSTNLSSSLYGFIKFFIPTMMFPVGYYFINSHDKLLKLSKFYTIALGFFMINILVSNVFKLGTSDYLEDSFYFGAGRVTVTKSTIVLIYAAIIFTLSSTARRQRLLIIFLSVSSFITIIGIKRSVLLSAILGILIFWITSKSKQLFLRAIIVFSIIIGGIFIVFPKTLNVFTDRLQAREERLTITEETIEGEARYNETSRVLNAWVNGSIKHKLIGSEMFNDAFFFKTHRMLHTDYMVLIAGSGLLGLFLWFVVLMYIIREKEKYWKYLKTDLRFQYYHPIFYSIIAAQLLMSISGTIQGVDLRSFIMLFLGAIVGSLRGEFLKIAIK
jgi:hypothetical protein